MTHNWFRRMLLAYTPVFFIVIFILFLIFFQALNEQSRREAANINESLAGQAYRYIDRSLKEIDHRVLRESLINESFQRFLNEQAMANVPVNLEALKSLQEIKLNYPIVDSIYLVRYNDQSVLSLGTMTKVSDYADRPFINDYINKDTSKWTESRLFREFSNQSGKEVISLTRPVPFYSKSKGLIVVNVSLDSLRYGIREMYDPEVSFVRLVDQKDVGFENEKANQDEEQVLSRLTSDYSGWTIESGLVQSNLSRIMKSINSLWLLISAIVVFTGIIWIIYITKKAYKPLEQLVGKIHLYSKEAIQGQPITTHRNEFTLIDHTLDQMLEQSNRYHQERDEVLLLRKKYGFEKLLKKTAASLDWEEEMEKIGLPQVFHPSVVFLMEMDQYSKWEKQLTPEQMLQLKMNIEETTFQMDAESLSILWCGWETEFRLVGVAKLVNEAIDPYEDFIKYKNQVREHSSLTVTIGVSRLILIPEDLRKAYREAEDALAYKAIRGLDQVIRYHEATYTEVDVYSHLKLAHEIVLAYRMSPDRWQDQYRQLFEELRTTKLRKEELVNIMNFFVYQLEREKHMFPQEIQKRWSEHVLPGLAVQLEQFDTIEELETNIFTLLEGMSNKIAVLRQARNYHQVLLTIKEYIEKNYDNVELSLDHLSGVFEMPGKNISKLFKEEFGEKFVDFLIRIRMERAEELLQTTNDTILAISEQVGYISANSFTRVFRKVYGTSPGEYRKLKKYL
ncbi:helix-turn-helix domain-containing protein [Lederbergia lenta]|uniref:AraC family transcriptional regulator n=1 Tax=Lederbergia lenta TaxID=1467 RepID=A0A2X4W104_LEDLE|nr:helix-turn-helix domain-containing protein [Lederbergia lenta]MEC2325769.1 helix-turn-helix domain-containing protein [Lederbergia lenta]SQI53778.1 AraC family transcriptional regulator [Lederbergia lenta]